MSRGTIYQNGEEPSLQIGQWRVLLLLVSSQLRRQRINHRGSIMQERRSPLEMCVWRGGSGGGVFIESCQT